jgi:hypothetical protein
VIFQCKWLVFPSIKQWPWPKVIPIYVIMTFIYASLYFVYILFDTRKMSKRVFLFMNHFNKKNYKGSHEMYNARSYLGTDKIQTYKNTCVGRIGYVLIYFRCIEIIIRLGVWIMHLIWSIAYGDNQGIKQIQLFLWFV